MTGQEKFDKHRADFAKKFWQEKVQWITDPRRKDRIVRVKGVHYFAAPESGPMAFRGHGGSLFKIRFFDGREMTSTNLWCQGDIPPEFRELLPDNAEFVNE